MAFQPVPNTTQVSLQGILPNSKTWVCNLYFEDDTYAVPTQAAADAWMSVIHDAYTSNDCDDCLSTGWQLSRVVFTGLNAQTDAQVVSTAHPVTGLSSADPLPNQAALLINWQTALRGRSYRGRNFHPGFTEAFSQGNEPTANVFTRFGNWAQDLIDGFHDTDRDMVVVSRFSGTELVDIGHGQTVLRPTPRDPDAVWTPITGYNIDDRWKTQRRRSVAG